VNFYNIIFYQLYKSLLKVGEKDIPIFSAIFVFSFLIYLNLLTLMTIIQLIFPIYNVKLSKIEFLLIYVITIIINLIYFAVKKRYNLIIQNLNGAVGKQNKQRFIYVSIYVCMTFLSFFILVSL
jgi:hypothetical protein